MAFAAAAGPADRPSPAALSAAEGVEPSASGAWGVQAHPAQRTTSSAWQSPAPAQTIRARLLNRIENGPEAVSKSRLKGR